MLKMVGHICCQTLDTVWTRKHFDEQKYRNVTTGSAHETFYEYNDHSDLFSVA